MTVSLKPMVWVNGDASEAAAYYAETFRDAQIVHQTPGMLAEISIHGRALSLLSGDDKSAPNPSISGLIRLRPEDFGGTDAAREYLDHLYGRLSEGFVLMPLQEYPFSPHYAWVQDRFGFTWQLMLENPGEDERSFFTPAFMFGGSNHFKAEEATNTWIELLDGERVTLRHSDGSVPGLDEGSVMFTDFKLAGDWFAAIDAGEFHEFTFSTGVSICVFADSQEEIDRHWAVLSTRPEAESCGWCADQWGVSWQVLPRNIGEIMGNETHRATLMQMGKIELSEFGF